MHIIGSPHPISRSSYDAGADHVINWPRKTQLHRGEPRGLLQILSPHPPLTSGPSMRGAHHRVGTKDRRVATLTGASTSVSWPILSNPGQEWPLPLYRDTQSTNTAQVTVNSHHTQGAQAYTECVQNIRFKSWKVYSGVQHHKVYRQYSTQYCGIHYNSVKSIQL